MDYVEEQFNYSTHRFTLDIHTTKSQVVIPVMYQDTGVQFYINLTDGGKPYHIAEGCNAVLYGKKPKQNQDGTFDCLIHDCEVVNDGTRIVYKFTKQTASQLGTVACEIRIYQEDGLLLTSPSFEIDVKARVIEDDEIIESDDERTALDRIFESEAAREEAEKQREKDFDELVSGGNLAKKIELTKTDNTQSAETLLAFYRRFLEELTNGTLVNKLVYNHPHDASVVSTVGTFLTVLSGTVNEHGDAINTNKNDIDLIRRYQDILSFNIADLTGNVEQNYFKKTASDEQTVQGDVKFAKDVTVTGDLKVNGENYVVDAKTLFVKDQYVICNVNDNGTRTQSGFVVITSAPTTSGNTKSYPAYGIVYDETSDSVRLGKGFVVMTNEGTEEQTATFTFTQNESQAIATRSDTIPNGNLVKWDADQNKMVDAETSLDMFSPDRVVQKGHFLYINKSGYYGNEYWNKMSGIVIPISGEYHGADNVCQDAYAIVFDHKTKTLRLGTGQILHSKDIYTGEGEIDYSYFEFGGYLHENGTEDEAIATRADNFEEGHIPIWQASTNMFIDSGVSLGDISTALDELHAYAQSLIGGDA